MKYKFIKIINLTMKFLSFKALLTLSNATNDLDYDRHKILIKSESQVQLEIVTPKPIKKTVGKVKESLKFLKNLSNFENDVNYEEPNNEIFKMSTYFSHHIVYGGAVLSRKIYKKNMMDENIIGQVSKAEERFNKAEERYKRDPQIFVDKSRRFIIEINRLLLKLADEYPRWDETLTEIKKINNIQQQKLDFDKIIKRIKTNLNDKKIRENKASKS